MSQFRPPQDRHHQPKRSRGTIAYVVISVTFAIFWGAYRFRLIGLPLWLSYLVPVVIAVVLLGGGLIIDRRLQRRR